MSESEQSRAMSKRRGIVAMLIAGALGFLTFVAISVRSNQVEAFDDVSYFTLALPTLAVACAILGYWAPRGVWRYGLASMGAHALCLLAIALPGGNLSLFPIGLAFTALLALPLIGTAFLGRWLRTSA